MNTASFLCDWCHVLKPGVELDQDYSLKNVCRSCGAAALDFEFPPNDPSESFSAVALTSPYTPAFLEQIEAAYNAARAECAGRLTATPFDELAESEQRLLAAFAVRLLAEENK